jgi:hypothetical protein
MALRSHTANRVSTTKSEWQGPQTKLHFTQNIFANK